MLASMFDRDEEAAEVHQGQRHFHQFGHGSTDRKRQQQPNKEAARHGRTYVSDPFDKKQYLCKATAATQRSKATPGFACSMSIVLGLDISFTACLYTEIDDTRTQIK
jgi:hypothetical protein